MRKLCLFCSRNNKIVWLSNMADIFLRNSRGAQRFVGFFSWLCFFGCWLAGRANSDRVTNKLRSHGRQTRSHGIQTLTHGSKLRSHGSKLRSYGRQTDHVTNKLRSHGRQTPITWQANSDHMAGKLWSHGRQTLITWQAMSFSVTSHLVLLSVLFPTLDRPLLDLLSRATEPPPAPGKRVLCRHPFDEAKRAYVCPSRVEPLYTVYWQDGKVGACLGVGVGGRATKGVRGKGREERRVEECAYQE